MVRAPDIKSELTMSLTPIYDPPERPKPHPICLLMPSADEDELQSLTDDIRAHGLLDPIVLFESRVLDGRNRAAACESAGLAPRYVEFEGTREEALMFVVSHNLKRRHLTKQAIADTLVEAEDFNLHYELGEPAAQSDIKMSAQKQKTASSRELANAAGRAVSREMINATRKVKEKAEPELREAVKRGRIGVQDAAKVADLPPEQQKAIAASPKPRRAANVAIVEAKNAALRSGDEDLRVALRRAWEKATALRRLWKEADNGSREWLVEVVWSDLNKGDDSKRAR
jgi:ParB-like chromosome segregation protein Spo0J